MFMPEELERVYWPGKGNGPD